VHAVANPQRFGVAPRALTERAPGFGVVVFNKRTRKIRLANYPRWADLSTGSAQPFPGWPITIDQMDNGLNEARWELRLPESVRGLVSVLPDGSDEPVLMWRTAGPVDRIPIWSPGVYRIKAGTRESAPLKATERPQTL
jgi:hypothetical protein